MTPELLEIANTLSADIRHMDGFIKVLPKHDSANCLAAVKVLYEDYHDTAVDYLNSDLFNVLQRARQRAEAHLGRLKKQFEALK